MKSNSERMSGENEMELTELSSVTLIHNLSEFFDESNSISGESIKFAILFCCFESTNGKFCKTFRLCSQYDSRKCCENQAKIKNVHDPKRISAMLVEDVNIW